MSTFNRIISASVSLLALAAPAYAQNATPEEGGASLDSEIIVSARRKDEMLQDVPLTVNALSAETLQKLNFRDLKDISSVVPGLDLSPGLAVSGPVASLRGVNVDVIASGNNGTVEFYLNDAPVSPGAVLQSIYDVGQIEVLRGPQGTLRGRASPSGSITINTRRPDLENFGGYGAGTITNIEGLSAQGAVNVPLIKGVLGFRVAGLSENNDANRVSSINNAATGPSAETRAIRASVRFVPTDNIEVNASYSRLLKTSRLFDQVESANLATGTALVGTLVTPRDRNAVMWAPRRNRQKYEVFNWQAQWGFAGQRLNYVGSYTKQDLIGGDPGDKGGVFNSAYPGDSASPTPNLHNLTSFQHTYVKQSSHELRLSSEDRLFGFMDYTVGGLINRLAAPSDLITRTPIFTGPVSPATFSFILNSPSQRRGRTLEKALFGNITAHLGERTEVSGGLRYIHFQDSVNTPGNATDAVYNATIWNASVKHRFSDDLMVYATAGSSWRLSSGTNPLILSRSAISATTITDPFLLSIFETTPERSKSYEIGLRSSWLDKRLTLNLSAYHQVFDGYIFSTPSVYVVPFNGVTYTNPLQTVAGLAASVPAKVDGLEAEVAFRASQHLDFGFSLAYAKSKISNGLIPCSPKSPPASSPPTVADIQGGSSTRQVVSCTVNQSASRLAPFSGSFQGEFSQPVLEESEAFVRGLVNFKGNSANDPQNPYDDVKAYALVNLFAGIRSSDRSWEIMAYGKNVFNAFRVLSRDATAIGARTSAGTILSNYRVIATTDPREFGITARIAFGSR